VFADAGMSRNKNNVEKTLCTLLMHSGGAEMYHFDSTLDSSSSSDSGSGFRTLSVRV
jgi:hypothetical protein